MTNSRGRVRTSDAMRTRFDEPSLAQLAQVARRPWRWPTRTALATACRRSGVTHSSGLCRGLGQRAFAFRSARNMRCRCRCRAVGSGFVRRQNLARRWPRHAGPGGRERSTPQGPPRVLHGCHVVPDAVSRFGQRGGAERAVAGWLVDRISPPLPPECHLALPCGRCLKAYRPATRCATPLCCLAAPVQ